MSEINDYWQKFLKDSGRNPEETGFSGEMAFEDRGITGDEQLRLLLSGAKTAAFSPFPAYSINREPLPVPGELYIAEDRDGNPCAIVELVDVQTIPFGQISWELASRDGEDESMEAWREKEKEYMEEEGRLCGFDFSDETPVVCEIMRVIYR